MRKNTLPAILSVVLVLVVFAGSMLGGYFANNGNAQAQGGTTTTTLDIAEMQNWIAQTANDAEAGSLVDKIGAYCDANPTSCVASQTGNWTVIGPAVIVTDPIGTNMSQYGWQVVKTFEMVDGRYGAYYCASSCTAPKPGRYVSLSGALTLTVVAVPTVVPTAGATSVTSLDAATLQSWINQTASDPEAGSLVDLIGAFCDTNPTSCTWSQQRNWTVTGPAVIVTDPIGTNMAQYGWSIVKTYQYVDGRYGAYYCASSCTAPKAGRAVLLNAPLP